MWEPFSCIIELRKYFLANRVHGSARSFASSCSLKMNRALYLHYLISNVEQLQSFEYLSSRQVTTRKFFFRLIMEKNQEDFAFNFRTKNGSFIGNYNSFIRFPHYNTFDIRRGSIGNRAEFTEKNIVFSLCIIYSNMLESKFILHRMKKKITRTVQNMEPTQPICKEHI